MFKLGSFEEELYKNMQRNLDNIKSTEVNDLNKLAKVVQYIHKAASIFEQAGMYKQAKELTTILEGLVK